jgi:hypothetical protein
MQAVQPVGQHGAASGQNHHPQDLEWTLSDAHPSIRPNCAAVFAVADDGLDRLIAVTEVDRHKLDEADEVMRSLVQGFIGAGPM